MEMETFGTNALTDAWQSQLRTGKIGGHCGGNVIGGQRKEGVGDGIGMLFGRGAQNFANTSSLTSASTWIYTQTMTSS